MIRSSAFRRILRVMSAGGSRAPCPRLVVRACADTRARTDKGAGGSEGARARVDRAAQVAISGDRADSGVAEERSQTGVTIYLSVPVFRRKSHIFADNSVGWHLATNSFHQHVRLLMEISPHI